MSESSISEIRNLQDKTTLKGVYFFLSISITFLIMRIMPEIEINSFLDPVNSIENYILIISISSVFMAILYYLQLELFIFKKIIRIISKRNDNYPDYKGIQLQNSLDHLFLSNDKKKLFSKVLFTLALILIMLSFLGENYFYIVLIFFTIIIAFLITLVINDLRKLLINIKLVYFMKLFIQENKLLKDSLVQDFVNYIKRNLWFEAKYAFSHIIKKYLKEISEPYHEKLKYQRYLENFYEYCLHIYDYANNFPADHHIVNGFLDKMCLLIDSSIADKYLYDHIGRIKESIEYFYTIISIISKWDNWLISFIFDLSDLDIRDEKMIISEFNVLFKIDDINKLKNLIKKSDSMDIQKRKNEIYALYAKLIKLFSKQREVGYLKYINNTFNSENFKKFLTKIRDKIGFLEMEFNLESRLEKKSYQQVFNSLNSIFQFYIKNFEKLSYQYEGTIITDIDILKKYEFDLDQLDIHCNFTFFPQINIEITPTFEIIMKVSRSGLLDRKVAKMDSSSKLNKIQQKAELLKYLRKKKEQFELKIKNLDFWEN